jgi:hypothetical protein
VTAIAAGVAVWVSQHAQGNLAVGGEQAPAFLTTFARLVARDVGTVALTIYGTLSVLCMALWLVLRNRQRRPSAPASPPQNTPASMVAQ